MIDMLNIANIDNDNQQTVITNLPKEILLLKNNWKKYDTYCDNRSQITNSSMEKLIDIYNIDD